MLLLNKRVCFMLNVSLNVITAVISKIIKEILPDFDHMRDN